MRWFRTFLRGLGCERYRFTFVEYVVLLALVITVAAAIISALGHLSPGALQAVNPALASPTP
jgi:hypothetical protein